MHVVFDLDGVLADTRELVVRAYADVGVIMPPEVWGRPWHEWLHSVTLHAAKTERYVQLIREGALDEHVTSVCGLLQRLQLEGIPTAILTGASYEAATVFIDRYLCNHAPMLLGYSCDMRVKKTALVHLSVKYHVTYVDDDPIWQNEFSDTEVHFVHYHGQDSDDLYREVTGWTP